MKPILLLAFLTTLLIRPQLSLAGPAFEVASIKPSRISMGGIHGGCHGIDSKYAPDEVPAAPLGRCVFTDGRLSHFILIAWNLHNLQFLKSRLDWVAAGNNRFNIEAKAEDPRTATEAELMEMFQALLIERFHLKFHRETVRRAGFALVAGKNGPKLQESTAGRTEFVSGGTKNTSERPGGITVRRYTMARLAGLLSGIAPGIVIDQTGLTGAYDFTLSWNEKTGPSIFTALQEQLGLRLQAQKVPVSYFVVDSAEKPGEN